jgi:ribosome-binding factor A
MTQSSRDVYKNKLISLIKRNVNEIIFKEIDNPNLESVIIKHIEFNGDNTIAYIYVETYKKDIRKEKLISELNKASGFIHIHLKKALHIKRIPKLVFRYDISTDYFFKMGTLLNKIENENNKEKN